MGVRVVENSSGDGMLGMLFHRSGPFDQFPLVMPAKRHDLHHLRPSRSERSRLVERDGFEMSRRFQVLPSFDKDTLPGGRSQAGHDADRR